MLTPPSLKEVVELAEARLGRFGRPVTVLLTVLGVVAICIGLIAFIVGEGGKLTAQPKAEASSAAPAVLTPATAQAADIKVKPPAPRAVERSQGAPARPAAAAVPQVALQAGHDSYVNNAINYGIMGPVIIAPTEPNVLYQDGRRVGTVPALPSVSGDIITFGVIRFADSVDTSRGIQYQRYTMICDRPPIVSDAAIFVDIEENVRCKVTGER